ILLEPTQQQIGDRVYEVTFIADTDGLPLEFYSSDEINSCFYSTLP
ncbi:MAG: hypothetical protein HC763_25055, partial [Hydrococcus sp. CRU_1_1]|nr:hypothetical protein [Hydrococcus sp. CRU_1_1]